MASEVRTLHDLEDRRPLTNLAINVLQNARGAREPHIDGTSKLLNKRLRGPRSTDTQKLESMFITIDRIGAIVSLAENFRQCLLSFCSNLNGSKSSLQPVIDALAFMGLEIKIQMVKLCMVYCVPKGDYGPFLRVLPYVTYFYQNCVESNALFTGPNPQPPSWRAEMHHDEVRSVKSATFVTFQVRLPRSLSGRRNILTVFVSVIVFTLLSSYILLVTELPPRRRA